MGAHHATTQIKEEPCAHVGRVSANQPQFSRPFTTENAQKPSPRRTPEHVPGWERSNNKWNPVGSRFSFYQDPEKPNGQGSPITNLRYSESPRPKFERQDQTVKVEPSSPKIKVEPQSPGQMFKMTLKEEPVQPSHRTPGLFGNTSSGSPFATLTNVMPSNTPKAPTAPMIRPESTLDAKKPGGGLFSNKLAVSPFAAISALSSGTNGPATNFEFPTPATGTEDRIKMAKDTLSGFLMRTTSAPGEILSTPATFGTKRKASGGESPHVKKRAKTFTGTNFSFAPAGVFDREITELFD
ncbi:hypothetical protein B0T14DRAFT_493472 [Immersiella caudata]|uniref:Uncharacterized protein n=1 Tax=Immersiella caudata TaxID=314043 RepID=A0AA39X4V7_9PEZI|nr:hypothetical protein B0T14DRAFT_493472 [Immersiella caudata]